MYEMNDSVVECECEFIDYSMHNNRVGIPRFHVTLKGMKCTHIGNISINCIYIARIIINGNVLLTKERKWLVIAMICNLHPDQGTNTAHTNRVQLTLFFNLVRQRANKRQKHNLFIQSRQLLQVNVWHHSCVHAQKSKRGRYWRPTRNLISTPNIIFTFHLHWKKHIFMCTWTGVTNNLKWLSVYQSVPVSQDRMTVSQHPQ